jgi:hypothetical protein
MRSPDYSRESIGRLHVQCSPRGLVNFPDAIDLQFSRTRIAEARRSEGPPSTDRNPRRQKSTRIHTLLKRRCPSGVLRGWMLARLLEPLHRWSTRGGDS